MALRYARRVLKATDMWVNVILGGELNEYISGRAARLRDKGVFIGCVLCRFLDVFEKGHCDKYVERESK